jgi:hypothetical protein
VAQVSSFVLEPLEESVDSPPAELSPSPVVAVVAAAPKAGTSSVARLLAAELAVRGDGAAAVWSGAAAPRRGAPPARAAARLATTLRASGAGLATHATGRLCIVSGELQRTIDATRYLAPVVLDLAADGSAAAAARAADRVVVVAGAEHEPALAAAVALVLGGEPLKVVTRVTDGGAWADRADLYIPDARIAARAAHVGTRALGPLGDAIAGLADALELEAQR